MRDSFGRQQLQERGAAGDGLGRGQVSIHGLRNWELAAGQSGLYDNSLAEGQP
jgi:hypothetical protein